MRCPAARQGVYLVQKTHKTCAEVSKKRLIRFVKVLIMFYLTRDGCAGTANFKISGSSQYLHVMWSSPNNFDKHASHLAVGVGPERCDKFHDMYYQRPTWFARKYVYHDTHGVWYHSPELVVHAKSTTRRVARESSEDVYVPAG